MSDMPAGLLGLERSWTTPVYLRRECMMPYFDEESRLVWVINTGLWGMRRSQPGLGRATVDKLAMNVLMDTGRVSAWTLDSEREPSWKTVHLLSGDDTDVAVEELRDSLTTLVGVPVKQIS